MPSIIGLTRKAIERFIYIEPSYSLQLATWIVASNCEKPIVPIPAVNALFPDSGKSQLCRVTARLVRSGYYNKGMSPAALRRKIAEDKNTLVLDEADTWLFDAKMMRDYARSLNGAFDQDEARTPIPEQGKSGGKYKLEDFKASGRPIMLSGLDILTSRKLNHPAWSATRTRIIPIQLEQSSLEWESSHPRYKAHATKYNPQLEALRQEIELWTKERKFSFKEYNPSMVLPSGRELFRRDADMYRMMFHIADLDDLDGHGSHGDEMRGIVDDLYKGRQPEHRKILLSACKLIIERKGYDAIGSTELLADLLVIDHIAIQKIKTTKALASEDNLGLMIKRVSDGKVYLAHAKKSLQGYTRDEVFKAHKAHCGPDDDAFVRRLMGDGPNPQPPPKPEEPEDANEINGLTPISSGRLPDVIRKEPEDGHGMAQSTADVPDPLAALMGKWQAEVDAMETDIDGMEAEHAASMTATARAVNEMDEEEFNGSCHAGKVDLWNTCDAFDAAIPFADEDGANELRRAIDRILKWVNDEVEKVHGPQPNGKMNGAWKGHSDD